MSATYPMYPSIKTLSVIRVMNYVTEGTIRKLQFSTKLIALSRFLVLFSGAASMSPATINGNYLSAPSPT
tara:strand:- start:72 stop:281 length:210 start_codon:yes stop_codon:yes gene_type:complete